MHSDTLGNPTFILERRQLTDLLAPQHDHSRPPLLLLLAPTGYGKSLLAQQLTNAAQPRISHVRRVRCTSSSRSEFWDLLHTQLTTPDSPRFDSKESSARDWVNEYAAAISVPTLLIIDQYHLVSDIETDHALIDLSHRSKFIHIVVLARSVKVLDGPLYSDRVVTIGQNALAFSADEIRELADRFSTELTHSVSHSLDLAGGWPRAVTDVLRAESPASRQLSMHSLAPRENDRATSPAQPHPHFVRLADDSFDILSAAERTILLSASLVDTLSLDQAAACIEQPQIDTQKRIQTLLELGLITQTRLTHRKVFRIHPTVRTTLATRALREYSVPERAKLLTHSARERESTDPLRAFHMHVEGASLSEAENVLAVHFTRITDRITECASLLKSFTEAELYAHPTFAAARLVLEFTDVSVSQENLQRITSLMFTGAKKRSVDCPDPASQLSLAHRVQVMIGERLHGNAPGSLAIAHELETQLAMSDTARIHDSLHTAFYDFHTQPVFLQELAFTAYLGGDFELAKRAWKRLLEVTCETFTATEPQDLTTTPVRPNHGTAWHLAALYGLAILETTEGDYTTTVELLSRADTLRDETGISAAALSWVNGEAARAHLAYQFRDDSMLRKAVEKVSPWTDRIEQWPMILLAEVENTRVHHGPDWAIPQLRSGVTHINRERRGVGVWGGYIAIYQVLLNTTLGNFTVSRRILSSLPPENPFVQIEQARLAIFSGDHVGALLGMQQLGVAGLTKRQQIDRNMISAIAAWGCGRKAEAFLALRSGAELIERCGLSMMLGCVPFDPLFEVGVAARDAGICDLTADINSVPDRVRCSVRERLTGMEQRALETMIPYPSLAAAAEQLSIAPATMKRHRLAIYRKLKVGSREEAILQGTRMGLLNPTHANTDREAHGG